MEPQLSPHSSPEKTPFASRSSSQEAYPGGQQERTPSSIEQGERHESREQMTGAGRGDAGAFPQPIAPVVPAQQPVPTTVTQNDNLADSTPLTAADEDLIEMEWVHKAKKIVSETKTDPYLQEREVSKLQASYLHKRYGKEVKVPREEE